MAKLKVDKELIRELAELLEQTGLQEIEWSEAGVQVRVARGGTVASIAAPAMVLPASAMEVPAAEPAPDLASHPGAVKSPMVGTVYLASEPGAAPFVRVGDTVSQGQTVLIVEAMKTMNPIPAPIGGKGRQLLVENQAPVEYGQVMLVIE